jgi:hypothetical protein
MGPAPAARHATGTSFGAAQGRWSARGLIVLSNTCQRSSEGDGKALQLRLFGRAAVRVLSGKQLYDSLRVAAVSPVEGLEGGERRRTVCASGRARAAGVAAGRPRPGSGVGLLGFGSHQRRFVVEVRLFLSIVHQVDQMRDAGVFFADRPGLWGGQSQ